MPWIHWGSWENCLESWKLILECWEGSGVYSQEQGLHRERVASPTVCLLLKQRGVQVPKIHLELSWWCLLRMKAPVSKQIHPSSRASRSQNKGLVSVSMAGADSSFVGGLTAAGKSWGARVILSSFLTPQRVETGCGSQTCSSHSNHLVSLFALTPRSWVHSWENLEPVWVFLAYSQPSWFFFFLFLGIHRSQASSSSLRY